MAGPIRALCYRVLLDTGLRREECGSLTPESFVLDSGTPQLRVAAKTTKNRKEAHQPLSSQLAQDLRVFLVGKPAKIPIFSIGGGKSAKMVRHDLAEAGIPTEVNGYVVDLHALRTTFGTRLAIAGVPLVMGQKLLRHSDPKLTSAVYVVAQLSDLRGR